MILVEPQVPSQLFLWERGRGDVLTEDKAVCRQNRETSEDASLEGLSDMTTKQGALATSHNGKSQRADDPLELLEGTDPCWHHDFGPVARISDFWPKN